MRNREMNERDMVLVLMKLTPGKGDTDTKAKKQNEIKLYIVMSDKETNKDL